MMLPEDYLLMYWQPWQGERLLGMGMQFQVLVREINTSQ
jgi:hypothetical protein